MSASEAAPADLSGVRRIEPFFCDGDHTGTGRCRPDLGQKAQSVRARVVIQMATIRSAPVRLTGRSARLCASSWNSAMSEAGIILTTRKIATGRMITSST